MVVFDLQEDFYYVRNVSCIYFLLNLMMVGNLFCGFMFVIYCIQVCFVESLGGFYWGNINIDYYWFVVYFIFGVVVFDVFDGWLVCMGGWELLFGVEFDLLVDVIFFGIVLVLMMFFFILVLIFVIGYEWFCNIGWCVGFIYLFCVVMWFVWFNVIMNLFFYWLVKELSKDFIGLFVLVVVSIVVVIVFFLVELVQVDKFLNCWVFVFFLLMVMIVFLMMSIICYLSGKNFGMQM